MLKIHFVRLKPKKDLPENPKTRTVACTSKTHPTVAKETTDSSTTYM